MSISKILIAAAMLGVASASCPNDCSGKGKCGDHDMCTCYPGYQGLDCSERTCLFGRAWGDVAHDEELAHDYAECSNNGICDRKTGECTCNDGFSGDACRYSTCPNGCNGHGTCEYISEIASDTSIQYQANSDRSYIDWDSGKSRFCKCDGGWSGVDCSARMCPKGNDPLTTHTPDEVGGNTREVQEIQTIQIQPHLYGDDSGVFIGLGGDFTLTYTDAYNQEWTTRPIRVKSRIAEAAGEEHFKITLGTVAGDTVTDTERRLDIFELYDVVEFSGLQSATVATSGAVKTITAITCANAAACTMTVSPPFDADEASTAGTAGTISITLVGSDAGEIGVKRMLSELPNQVLPDSTVDETIAVDSNQFRVTFSDAANSGDQHLLKCKVAACDTDGCQPRKKAIKGIYQAKLAAGVMTTTAIQGVTDTANFLPSGTVHVSFGDGSARDVTVPVSARASATELTVSGGTSLTSGAMTVIQTQDFTDDSVGEAPVLDGFVNSNAFKMGAATGSNLVVTSSNQVNSLAGWGLFDYTLTVADADATNTALSWTASSKTLAVGGSGSFTAGIFLNNNGRAIQAGDTITTNCAHATLAASDGTYTVESVANQAIVVTETVAGNAAASDGVCTISVKMGSGTTGASTHALAAGDRVSLKCTDAATYAVTIADADDGETSLSYVEAAGSVGQHMLLTNTGGDGSTFQGAATAVTMLDGGAAGGRAIQAGDKVAIACVGASLQAEDYSTSGGYTVDSVTATQLFLSGRTFSGAAAAADGTCTFTVTPHTRASALDGYYNIDSVSATTITLDRAIDASLAGSSSMSCTIKKIRDSPCTVVETRKGTSENYECSRRGNCDSQTGLCGCFAGYTGEDCSVQTVLV